MREGFYNTSIHFTNGFRNTDLWASRSDGLNSHLVSEACRSFKKAEAPQKP